MKKLILALAIAFFAAPIAAEPQIGDTVRYKTYHAVITHRAAWYTLWGDTVPTYTYTVRSVRPNGIQFGRLIYPVTANVREEQIKTSGKKANDD